MTAILGISGLYHDSAAALVVDGEIVSAAQEERFTRKKHDPAFPKQAIEYCLSEANLTPGDLDFVGFYDKPLLTFERLLETYLSVSPRGFRSFLHSMPVWLKQKLYLPRLIKKELGGSFKKRIVFTRHHDSHAASAFFPSPFEESAILTVDGVGEWATATLGAGAGNKIKLSHELRFPHSIGLLYSAFTYYCGFKVNSGEYKLMGLAPYGEPKYAELIKQKIVDIKDDGSIRLNMRYFDYCRGMRMTSAAFHKLLGGPPRKPESELTQRHMDLAASVQLVTEEIILKMARRAQQLSGSKNLCMAGGVALNCVANGRILRESEFEKIWIQPAAGDAGGALGVAQFIWYQLLENERQVKSPDGQTASLLGPKFKNGTVKTFLDSVGAKYKQLEDEAELCSEVAKLIASEKVIGWMQGRMEFGPRALGARSILGDARSEKMQSVMNLKIKFRESFRPFAPVVLRERVDEYFEMKKAEDSPYMLLVANVCAAKLTELSSEQSQLTGLNRLNIKRSEVPAITHVDNSARVQTADETRHGRYYKLLKEFENQTGSPVLINTSFNVRGEPIVCTPQDAYRCFMATDMDVLVIEDFVLLKAEQPNAEYNLREKHLGEFALD